LQWVRAHHCPWGVNTCLSAVGCAKAADGGGHEEVARWIRAQIT
jgi:hypothetical protein